MSMERYLGDIGEHNWKDCHLESQVLYLAQGKEETSLWLWASSYEYSDGGSGELSGDDLARFHGLVLTSVKRLMEKLPHISSPPTRSGEMKQWGLRVTWFLLLTCLDDGGNHSMENTWQGGLKCGTLFEASHIPTVSLGRPANQLSAMSKRLKLSDLAKVVAKKAATSASKGVVISEGSETTSGKRALDDGSKGKQVAQSPEPKKARTTPERPGLPRDPLVISGAEKILAGVVLPADKEKVDRLTFDQVVTKFLHVVGQVFSFPSKMFSIHIWCGNSDSACSRGYLGVFSRRTQQDFAEGALNQKAVAESAENGDGHLEVRGEDFRSGKRASPSHKAGSSPLSKSRMIFLEAVRGSASSYFGDGFDFCKRQLAKQYLDLGVDLEDVEMDQELLAKEEAEAEKRAVEEEAAEVEGVGEAA
ncbi:hypothetical protein Acr_06g0002980 [Actinidia rufa]|uniref:Uncharacterized protein n=1 Tax=Actinidia rufa TaxID=165716 RepID=A0A7J0EPE4_9ERIC|nr:hypothetical protein Acr_06g0002980 [Actinidia rufa]